MPTPSKYSETAFDGVKSGGRGVRGLGRQGEARAKVVDDHLYVILSSTSCYMVLSQLYYYSRWLLDGGWRK